MSTSTHIYEYICTYIPIRFLSRIIITLMALWLPQLFEIHFVDESPSILSRFVRVELHECNSTRAIFLFVLKVLFPAVSKDIAFDIQ